MNPTSRWPDLLVPAGLVLCLLVIFVPLPAGVMDVLLAANITISVVILLTSIQIRTPLELSIFPALLLATTFARLALNISTTRLILTRGALDGEQAAGGVIASFGNFVAGNDLAVGLIIFAIIVVVQFVVITKGATRISEVAARFALDGMPGAQMAIDADLNSGVIDTHQAQARRAEAQSQADFYGSMDGASKFVRGDAIAGVLITGFNIVGGLVIGMTQGMNLSEAAATFTTLTIGDGLVSQLPALLISLAAALLIARSHQPTNLPRESIRQLFGRPAVLVVAAGFLGLLVFTSLPALPLLAIAASCLGIAWMGREGHLLREDSEEIESAPVAAPTEITIDRLLRNDVLEMELGIGLIKLANPADGGQLLGSITAVRQQLASELGMILPKVRVRDNLNLGRHEYRILLQGNPTDGGEILPDCSLAVDFGNARGPIERNVVKAVFNDSLHTHPAYWIANEHADRVADLGYHVLNATDVLADQLKQFCRHYADELLTRDAAKQLLDEFAKLNPAVLEDLVPERMSIGQVQKVLKHLLREGVSIRGLGLILETLGDHAGNHRDLWELTGRVRQRLARQIISAILEPGRERLAVITLDDSLQNRLAAAWNRSDDEIRLDGLSTSFIDRLGQLLQESAVQLAAAGRTPVAVVRDEIRPVIAELAIAHGIELAVLAEGELGTTPIEILSRVPLERLSELEKPAA